MRVLRSAPSHSAVDIGMPDASAANAECFVKAVKVPVHFPPARCTMALDAAGKCTAAR